MTQRQSKGPPFPPYSHLITANVFQVMLDLLISTETDFLEYLLRVLRLTHLGPRPSPEDTASENALTLLGNLNSAVSRLSETRLFPYNARPLLARFSSFLRDNPGPGGPGPGQRC